MKKKLFILFIVVLAIAVACVLFIRSGQKTSDTNTADLNSYVETQIKAIELRSKLDRNSTYPDYYEIYCNSNEEDAITAAENAIIKNEAIRWYADKKGLNVNSETIDNIMSDLIESEKSGGDNGLDEVCKQNNIEYSELITNERCVYARQAYYEAVYQDYFNGEASGAMTSEEIEKVKEKWNKYLDTIISEFKKTNRYEELLKALSVDKELAKNDTTDIKTIQEKDILVDGYYIDL